MAARPLAFACRSVLHCAAVGTYRKAGGYRSRPFHWVRRRREPTVPEPVAPRPVGERIVIVQGIDFVCCRYAGCGTLQRLEDIQEGKPCAGCGRY